jgi:hypothetical protein
MENESQAEVVRINDVLERVLSQLGLRIVTARYPGRCLCGEPILAGRSLIEYEDGLARWVLLGCAPGDCMVRAVDAIAEANTAQIIPFPSRSGSG